MLLFLHGGPGDVTSCWSFALFAPWEEHFTVVQWDQRGAGRTLEKTGPAIAPTLTVNRMAKDGIELAEYLRKHLGKDKIILVAHSFGSLLGLQMVRARPDLFYAYVGTGEIADEPKNYAVAYDALLKKARAVGNQRAIDELTKVGPPPYSSYAGYSVQRKWSNLFEGSNSFLDGTIGLTLEAPGCSVKDVNDSDAGQLLSGERLFPQTRSSGPKELGLTFSVPIFFFQGAEDFTAPTALARDYLDAIQAPYKKFVPIQGAGHFAVFTHSDQFLEELVTQVRPLAVKPNRPNVGRFIVDHMHIRPELSLNWFQRGFHLDRMLRIIPKGVVYRTTLRSPFQDRDANVCRSSTIRRSGALPD